VFELVWASKKGSKQGKKRLVLLTHEPFNSYSEFKYTIGKLGWSLQCHWEEQIFYSFLFLESMQRQISWQNLEKLKNCCFFVIKLGNKFFSSYQIVENVVESNQFLSMIFLKNSGKEKMLHNLDLIFHAL
jgi:hypothetical protein